MKPEGSPRDDFDVSLQWPEGDLAGDAAYDDPGLEEGSPPRQAPPLRRPPLGTGPVTKDLESIVAAIESLRGVVEQLVDSVTSMRKVLDATNSKVERLATRRPAAKETAARDTTSEFRDKLAELTHQVELLRKRVSLRARSEQLSAEAAERIASAVIDSLADTIPEAGPRLRSRRRSARS